MEQTDLKAETEWVVQELGGGADRNDVIMRLCEARGWSWQRAEQFVTVTEESKRRNIAVQQSPLLIILGIGITIAGVAGLAYGLYEILIVHYVSRGIIAAVIVGFGMTVGGPLGTWRAVMAIFRD